jgi:hypothetical protein
VPTFPPITERNQLYVDEYGRKWRSALFGTASGGGGDVYAWRRQVDLVDPRSLRTVSRVAPAESAVITVPDNCDHTLIIAATGLRNDLRVLLPVNRFDGQVLVIKTVDYQAAGKLYPSGTQSGNYIAFILTAGASASYQFSTATGNWEVL